ncbi:MAG TPA: hypothetical protein VKX17_05720 [Planctomycetota bacterium]|nr:hypothetical protein [Planctomycetota bacterium]
MLYTEVITSVESLTKKDKIKLLRKLAEELTEDEQYELEDLRNYPIWSPFDAHEAADRLLEALEADKAQKP